MSLRVAKAVARGEPPYAGAKQRAPEIARVLAALRDAGIIESRGRGKGWRIVVPLLRRYLSQLGPLS